jgi:hypothetical protein
VSNNFIAPNGQTVTVTVKSPVTTRTYKAPSIAPGQDPLAYFAQQITAAGSGALLMIPNGTYNFAALDCTNAADPKYHAQHIIIQSVHDVIIDGQGSTLNFVTDCPGIKLNVIAQALIFPIRVVWL